MCFRATSKCLVFMMNVFCCLKISITHGIHSRFLGRPPAIAGYQSHLWPRVPSSDHVIDTLEVDDL